MKEFDSQLLSDRAQSRQSVEYVVSVYISNRRKPVTIKEKGAEEKNNPPHVVYHTSFHILSDFSGEICETEIRHEPAGHSSLALVSL